MASFLVQAGTSLYLVSPAGVATEVSLPSTITLYGADQPCRATLFGAGQKPIILVVNGGTHDFFLDETGTARQLQISSPTGAPVPTAGAGSGLTGIYYVASNFKVKDPRTGATIFETSIGPLSPASASLTNKTIRLDAIPVSGDAPVNARGLFRTLSGGTTLYPWFDIDDNVTLLEDRGVVDSLLSLLPTLATRYGAPPDLSRIVSWKDRLWGVPRMQIDNVRWTEERTFYGWSADNEIIIPPKAVDTTGVVAFIPRRDQLGIGRRRHLYMIVGDSNDTFKRVQVSATIGVESDESVVVVHNTAYFLGPQGVAEWTDEGVGYVSDAQVWGWFNTDDFFNRALFPQAQGRYNPDTDSYELLLADKDSTVLDRWVSFDLVGRRWYGPHKTGAFSPSCAGNNSLRSGVLTDDDALPISVLGGTDGHLYARDTNAINDFHAPVTMDVDLPFLDGDLAEQEKLWLQPSLHTRVEEADSEPGPQLTITPVAGDLDSPAQDPMIADLTLGREVLPILGNGRYLQLNLAHESLLEGCQVQGLEIPYIIVGRR